MNAIKSINDINQKELENNTSDSASWHADYKDTSYIFIGHLPVELAELDIIKIFSQYGNPTHINLIKDKETGKSRGFCYLKYEDYRSCVLAIDNFNGIKVFDKLLKVDHVYYELRDGQNEDDFLVDFTEAIKNVSKTKRLKGRTKLLEYKSEFEDPIKVKHDQEEEEEGDDEFKDPMANYISKSKRHKKHRDHGRKRHHN